MHGGLATPTVTDARVFVSGMPIVTQPGPWTVAACALPPPPAANGPCVTGQFFTASVRVTASFLPVLLIDSQSMAAPTGTPLLPVQAQPRVFAT
jgi:hypothetical protein